MTWCAARLSLSLTVGVCVGRCCRSVNIVDAITNKLNSYTNDLETKILERTRELEEERMKSELLLYSMMPP